MMQVVNIKDVGAPSTWADNYVYIGRAMPRRGLKASPLANPFRIDVDGDRAEVIDKYKDWLRWRIKFNDSPQVIAALKALTPHSVLVCWCAPEPCHGDEIKAFCERMWAKTAAGA